MILKDLLSIKPLDNRLIEGLSVTEVLNFANKFPIDKQITVASDEENYLFLAKAVKDKLIENGFKVNALVVGKDYNDELKETEAV